MYYIVTLVLYSFSLLLAALLYRIFLKPIYELMKIKVKYGDSCEIYFFPLIGRWIHALPSADVIKRKLRFDCAEKLYLSFQNKPNSHKVKFQATNIGDKINYVFNDPQMIQELLVKKYHFLKKNMILFPGYDKMFSQGIIQSEGKDWKIQRTLIAPLFTFQAVESRIPEILKSSQNFISNLHKADNINRTLISLLQKTTGDIVGATFFGEKFIHQKIDGQFTTDVLYETVEESLQIGLTNPWTQLRSNILGHSDFERMPHFLLNGAEKKLNIKIDKLNSLILSHIKEAIDSKSKEIEANQKASELKTDFMTYLAESVINKTLTEKNTLHLFQALFTAGMDTTAHLLLMSFYYFSENQDIQQEIREQIVAYQKECLSDNSPFFSVKNLMKLNKLAAFLQEVLRLAPPAQGLLNRVTTEAFSIGNIYIPKNSEVGINTYICNMNPKNYENPEKIDLNRKYNDSSLGFLPFSMGPRNCIGQHMGILEAKIILIQTLLHFQIDRNMEVPLQMVQTLIYKPQYDNLVTFKPLTS